jgi:phage repressor protein C with HTH and peptisase S24 domain
VQLLVRRAGGTQRELLDAVAAEARMRVAVDEARQRAEPAAVELLEVAVGRREVAHAADRGDATVLAENVRVLEHRELAERPPPERRLVAGRRDQLGQVADEEPARRRGRVGRLRRHDIASHQD